MRQAQHAKSSLFLMEMMVVILFFALTSAICVHLFVQSYQSAKHSEALTNGVLQAQSAAEVYKTRRKAGELIGQEIQHIFQRAARLALIQLRIAAARAAHREKLFILHIKELAEGAAGGLKLVFLIIVIAAFWAGPIFHGSSLLFYPLGLDFSAA